jgi:hypothetical protein
MGVRIYQPSKTAMQSGRAKTHKWVLEFEPEGGKGPEPLMGWTASADTRQQVHLEFDSREEAVGYADKHGLAYTLVAAHDRRIRPKAYADNFSFYRSKAWTH